MPANAPTQRPQSAPSIECALLVLSCDPYADLWPPFFALLQRHWSDCPFPVFLGAGSSSQPPLGISVLSSGGGRDWSKCTSDYLRAIKLPYVLLMLDDFFLRRPVSTAKILQCLDFARAHHAIQLRLIPRPGPTDPMSGETNIGSCATGSPYRLSTQAAIWDRLKLLELLRPGESIWEFEHQGNDRAGHYPEGFFSVKKSVLPYDGFWAHHVIEKGKWIPHEKWIFARSRIGCDFSRRGTLPWSQMVVYHLAQLTIRGLGLLPWRAAIRAKQALKSLLWPFFRNTLDRLGQTPLASRLEK